VGQSNDLSPFLFGGDITSAMSMLMAGLPHLTHLDISGTNLAGFVKDEPVSHRPKSYSSEWLVLPRKKNLFFSCIFLCSSSKFVCQDSVFVCRLDNSAFEAANGIMALYKLYIIIIIIIIIAVQLLGWKNCFCNELLWPPVPMTLLYVRQLSSPAHSDEPC